MTGNYGAIGNRNRKKPDYWTPRFITGVFDESSYPVNRANRAYEIVGMSVATGQLTNAVGTFVFNNGDVAVFNSQGVLIEILGDAGEGGGPSNNFAGAFLETWTPEKHPGTHLYFADFYSGNTFDMVLENDDTKIIVTGNDQHGYVVTQQFLPLNNDKNGIAFKLGSAADDAEFPDRATFMYGGFFPAGETPETITAMYFCVFYKDPSTGPNNNNWLLAGMGDFQNDDQLNLVTAITIPWSPDLELTLAYDRDASTYGTMYLYSNVGPTGTLIASHAFSALRAAPGIFGAQISVGDLNNPGSAKTSVEIINNPSLEIPGVVYHGGGDFNLASYPTDPEGKAYTVIGLTEPIDVPYIGLVENGDMVFFNNAGMPQGRPWGRDDISNLAALSALIADNVGKLGVQTWTPEQGVGDTPTNWNGTYAWNHGYNSSYYSYSSYDYVFQIGAYVASQTKLSVATGPIFKALPNTIEGMMFRLSDGTSVPYITNATYRAGFGTGITGSSQEYDPEGIVRRYFEIDISNGSLVNPRFYYGVSGSTHAIPLMSFSLGDLLFLGASKTQLYIKNITTNQEYTHTYTEESFSDTEDKRFFASLNVNSTGDSSSYFHLMVESSQSGGPYPYIGGNQPNGRVSNDALPLPRGNRSFEVGGLSSYGMVWYPPSGYPNSTTLKNGDIVVFNRGGDVVKIMSNSDYEN